MRVTQSMLSNNMLRNLNNNYKKLSDLQNQINTGRKVTRPSEDPVIATKGMGYRTDLNKIEQFDRNITQVNAWLDASDDALDQVGSALNRVKELIVQASSDTNTAEDREKIKREIDQIRLQIQDVANTQIADKYIFSGTKTDTPLFKDGEMPLGDNIPNEGDSDYPKYKPFVQDVKFEVFDGVQLNVNTLGYTLFYDIDKFMEDVSNKLGSGATGDAIDDYLSGLSDLQNSVLEKRADVGARQNRIDMMSNRLSVFNISVTKQLSENEDVDYAESISKMVTAQSIHQASLSVGANIIQQTLVDFIR